MPAVRPRFHLAPCSKFRSHLSAFNTQSSEQVGLTQSRSTPGSLRPSKCADSEMEALRNVDARFADWVSVVDTQRAERRIPDQTRADRRTHALGIRDRQRLRQRRKPCCAPIA